MNPFEQELKNGGNELTLNSAAVAFLDSTAKWARFLGILGFIGIGLIVVVSLILFFVGLGTSSSYSGRFGGGYPGAMGGMSLSAMGLIYMVSAGIYFFPVLYLYNFAARMQQALQLRDSSAVANSFEQLRNHYRFIGILTIVMIAIYVLIFFFAILVGASRSF